MALYHLWDVKNDFAYVLQFFSLISYSLGSVKPNLAHSLRELSWAQANKVFLIGI